MSQAKDVMCIYCKEVRAGSKEHILQASLGGNLTTPLVCKICNTGFSKIDQSLAENSVLALTRVGLTQKGAMPVQLGGEHYWQDASGRWCDVKVVNEFQAVLLPQIHLAPLGEQLQLDVVGGDYQALHSFLELVDDKVADKTLLSVHIRVGPPDKCPSARLVGHRSDAMYIRAISEDQGNIVRQTLFAKWEQFRVLQKSTPPQPTEQHEMPSVQVTMSVCPDDNYRGVAKIAFNLLAATKGADFILREEFDPIRSYIRGLDLVHKAPLPEGEVAVDTRYVHPLAPGAEPLVPTRSHAVVITYTAPVLAALVTLYEKTSFLVRLAEIQLSEEVLIGHEFSIDRSANNALEISELAKRLGESSN
jgi:hypothetical protein